MWDYLKRFLLNLGLLSVLLLGLYLFYPGLIKEAYQVIGMMFGPLLIVALVVVSALPPRGKR